MSEHTAGPWAWSGDGSGGEWGQLNSADGVNEVAYPICDGGLGGASETIVVNFDADAHLIAAAPDLLKAAEAAVKVSLLPGKHGDERSCPYCALIETHHATCIFARLAAAIEKAEGKKP